MNIAIPPLIIFLILLSALLISIVFANKFPALLIMDSAEGYTDYSGLLRNLQQYNSGGGAVINSGTTNYSPVNLPIVYDASGVVVSIPVIGKVYYDAKGNPVNFPKDKKAYNESGNVISAPPITGFMLDSIGNPIDLPVYDQNNVRIASLSAYNGPVYDSYHNLIQFPYYDANNRYTVSPIITPDIYVKYTAYMKQMNNSSGTLRFSDISGCSINYDNITLDDYISNYYQHFWNQNRQMYSDDYILKTEIVPPNCPSWHTGWASGESCGKCEGGCKADCTKHNNEGNNRDGNIPGQSWNNNISTGINGNWQTANIVQNLGNELKTEISDAAQHGKSLLTINPTQLSTASITPQLQPAPNSKGLAGNYNGDNTTANIVQNLGNELKTEISDAAQHGKSLLTINPTQLSTASITPQLQPAPNSKGLAGNYNGDNTTANLGYLSGIQQFSQVLPSETASFNNNYNAVPSKGGNSDFLPLTTDFSKFGK